MYVILEVVCGVRDIWQDGIHVFLDFVVRYANLLDFGDHVEYIDLTTDGDCAEDI